MWFAVVLAGCVSSSTSGDEESKAGLLEQDAACAAWLECLAAEDPATLGAVTESYGPDGSCWTSEDAAATCAVACQTGLEQAHDAWPDEALCDDGSPSTAYDFEGDWEFTSGEVDDCNGTDVELRSLYLSFYADSDEDFQVEGHGTLFTSSSMLIDVETECTIGSTRFTCDSDPTDYDTVWDLSGSYEGVLALRVKVETDSCKMIYEVEGARQ